MTDQSTPYILTRPPPQSQPKIDIDAALLERKVYLDTGVQLFSQNIASAPGNSVEYKEAGEEMEGEEVTEGHEDTHTHTSGDVQESQEESQQKDTGVKRHQIEGNAESIESSTLSTRVSSPTNSKIADGTELITDIVTEVEETVFEGTNAAHDHTANLPDHIEPTGSEEGQAELQKHVDKEIPDIVEPKSTSQPASFKSVNASETHTLAVENVEYNEAGEQATVTKINVPQHDAVDAQIAKPLHDTAIPPEATSIHKSLRPDEIIPASAESEKTTNKNMLTSKADRLQMLDEIEKELEDDVDILHVERIDTSQIHRVKANITIQPAPKTIPENISTVLDRSEDKGAGDDSGPIFRLNRGGKNRIDTSDYMESQEAETKDMIESTAKSVPTPAQTPGKPANQHSAALSYTQNTPIQPLTLHITQEEHVVPVPSPKLLKKIEPAAAIYTTEKAKASNEGILESTQLIEKAREIPISRSPPRVLPTARTKSTNKVIIPAVLPPKQPAKLTKASSVASSSVSHTPRKRSRTMASSPIKRQASPASGYTDSDSSTEPEDPADTSYVPTQLSLIRETATLDKPAGQDTPAEPTMEAKLPISDMQVADFPLGSRIWAKRELSYSPATLLFAKDESVFARFDDAITLEVNIKEIKLLEFTKDMRINFETRPYWIESWEGIESGDRMVVRDKAGTITKRIKVGSCSVDKLRSDLFRGYGFIMSVGEEDPRMDKERMRDLLEKHSGIVGTFEELRSEECTQLCLISPKFSRTGKYFTALAMGIPRVRYSWILSCVAANSILPVSHIDSLCNGHSEEYGEVLGSYASPTPVFQSLHVNSRLAAVWTDLIILGGGRVNSTGVVDLCIVDKDGDSHSDSQQVCEVVDKEWILECLIQQRRVSTKRFMIKSNGTAAKTPTSHKFKESAKNGMGKTPTTAGNSSKKRKKA